MSNSLFSYNLSSLLFPRFSKREELVNRSSVENPTDCKSFIAYGNALPFRYATSLSVGKYFIFIKSEKRKIENGK